MRTSRVEAIILIALMAFVGWGCSPALSSAQQNSPEMEAILKARRLKDEGVSTAGLPQLSVQESEQRVHSLESAGTMEVFPVSPKPGTQDTFSYVIWRDLKTNEFWIVRSGGFAGSTVVFGPGKIEQK